MNAKPICAVMLSSLNKGLIYLKYLRKFGSIYDQFDEIKLNAFVANKIFCTAQYTVLQSVFTSQNKPLN